jgi:hypothetical protein
VQDFADRLSKRSAVATFETRRAMHSGLELNLSRGLAEEMSATMHCCDDAGTYAALEEYNKILQELVFDRPDNPASIDEVMEEAEQERMTRHFKAGD